MHTAADDLTHSDIEDAASEIAERVVTLTGSPCSRGVVLDAVDDVIRQRDGGRSEAERATVLASMAAELADREYQDAQEYAALTAGSGRVPAAASDALSVARALVRADSIRTGTGEWVPAPDDGQPAPVGAEISSHPGARLSADLEVSRLLALAAGEPLAQVPGEADQVISRHPELSEMFTGQRSRVRGLVHEHRTWEDDDDPTDDGQPGEGGAAEYAAEVDWIIGAHNGNMFGLEEPKTGSASIKPKSAGHRALERGRSRPGRGSGSLALTATVTPVYNPAGVFTGRRS